MTDQLDVRGGHCCFLDRGWIKRKLGLRRRAAPEGGAAKFQRGTDV